ncbi:MAG TPA: response regulator transcription factor [Candidatus Tyrphobacter sp.]
MAGTQIVVAEDDAAIRELVGDHLRRDGYGVVAVEDGYAALRAAREIADLLVLDLGLPGIDGLDVVRALQRERRLPPTVMLTARAAEIDRVLGFEAGAEDYVCKPFSPRELTARVRAVLRRRGASGTAHTRTFGRLEIDERAREVRVDGCAVALKPQEYALLVELASNPGVALSRERLLVRAWGFDFDGEERTVDVHVRRLRAKLEERFGLAPFIETLYGFGYRFRRT